MKTWNQYIEDQKLLCKKVGIQFYPAELDLRIGIADNVFTNLNPVNGLRHLPELVGTGWFVYSGEEFSNDINFFKPYCIKHLIDLKPEIIKYLGLPPGFRFLIDDKGYEDIWFDKNLLLPNV